MRRSGLALVRAAASLGGSSGAHVSPTVVAAAQQLLHTERPAIVAFLGAGLPAGGAPALPLSFAAGAVVNIEYDPEHVDAFIAIADAIEEAFPGVVVEGNPEGDGRPGSFEICTEDGVHIYSKLQAKAHPDAEDVVNRIANRAKLGPAAPAEDMCG
ncbi:hypothetical protein HYH02_009166 [Chlamydomonas schloesseri]|uniref:Uncharacterized protein n=1 Tax=Chlamydomonas schloesseri TaxID=2026947 RepID=A0A835WBD1_9CHLO|nr:hypothetical protein HYH02_009166 [Chlamydomonas schloesseri]|eukprot:KAG2444229.1 hypothetical protein HYH02_009166 [Chlamydomonas schloesseri]